MRIWTLHPQYLDPQGLVALWREGLLAQKVLQGGTRGYRSHPQLARFRTQEDPPAAMAAYLTAVRDEAVRRGYAFDASRIQPACDAPAMTETQGQLDYEWGHLLEKLRRRAPGLFDAYREMRPEPHPCFRIVPGPVAAWERTPTPR